ncbi:TetR/AcrR family transcriptional regulator [Boudabousia marimammalium]|uniref:HTH tetR-type domain-containing protein n=1 Tax=Boudabousia marimammalium TaxID=156892 RepID=A0A1Q5PSK2_9ACTO|nr:TetR/AcrR family transcriptional regulator [Boudabousia marimammalium]OKL50425.1 hypothetical protein BM477_00135 [Boudabousia marimammalium]
MMIVEGSPQSGHFGRKTGPKPKFSTADAVEAALNLGLDRFTFAAVAKRLGVTTASLYRLFADRAALVDAALARIAGELEAPSASLSWQDQLRKYVDDVWGMCERYPGFPVALIHHPGGHVHIKRYVNTMVERMLAAGFQGGPELAAFALDFLGDTALSTYVGVQEITSVDESGVPMMEQAKARYNADPEPGPAYFEVNENWLGRGFLDVKVEFVLAAFGDAQVREVTLEHFRRLAGG